MKPLSHSLPLLAALAAFLSSGQASAAADPMAPDWPCVQRKVPEITAAMIWGGPPVDERDERWREAPETATLVRELAARRLPIEQAFARIDAFAEAAGADRERQLTALFTGLLQIINIERREIIAGIERYARKQRALAERIKRDTAALSALRTVRQAGDRQEAGDALEERLLWSIRIYDERRDSLRYVCEAPVLLEQRLFALARHIASHLP